MDWHISSYQMVLFNYISCKHYTHLVGRGEGGDGIWGKEGKEGEEVEVIEKEKRWRREEVEEEGGKGEQVGEGGK